MEILLNKVCVNFLFLLSIDRTITPEQVSNAQKNDISLTTTRSRYEANETIGKATFFKKNDLLYRKFSSPNVEQGKIFECGARDEEVNRRYGRNDCNISKRYSILKQMEAIVLIPFFCVFHHTSFL